MTTPNPYYLRETQPWAVQQEIMRHNQALYMVGEYAMFALMWHIEDFRDGLVQRCSTCWVAYGDVAAAYGQVSKAKCATCYGTTFQGGIRNLIVRPIIFPDNPDTETQDPRGIIEANSASIETTTDFRLRQHDYMFRADGSRYQVTNPGDASVRTGFAFPYQAQEGVSYKQATVTFEDLSSVAYLIPPDYTTLNAILLSGHYEPYDFTSVEVHNDPLIPSPDSGAN